MSNNHHAVPSAAPAGIYIHIPFCERKCPYCDFYSVCDPSLQQPFTKALLREIELTAPEIGTCDTIYLGGGTPTVMGPQRIAQILEKLMLRNDLLPDSEITIEANPGTVDRRQLEQYRNIGINRINIGVQSFNDDNLRFLGRIHSAEEAARALKWAAAAGFGRIGLDLIYGLPGQRPGQWQAELETALSFAPAHISCYSLTLEPGTRLERDFRHGLFSAPAEDHVAQMLRTTVAFLAQNGYEQYEVSNFARRPEYQSRHNLKYWTFAPYLGLGPAAHSYLPPVRCWNKPDVRAYVADLSAGDFAVAASETLSRRQMMIEAVFLGLRMNAGIDVQGFETRFEAGFSDLFDGVIKQWVNEGLLAYDGRRCALTTDGLLLMDSIAARMVDCIPADSQRNR